MPPTLRRFGLLAAMSFGLAAGSASAQTTDLSFRLTNNGSVPIDEIYVSSSTQQIWGPDRLGDRTLDVGQNHVIRLPAGQCVNDIRVVWTDGRTQERRQVNICNLTDIAFP